MGYTFATITVKNAMDEGMVLNGLIKESEVRSVELEALVDTGAQTLVISEALFNKLGLTATRADWARLAGDNRAYCNLTSPVSIYWKGRIASCNAIVFPGDTQTLLGAIPLELMDVIVNPKTQTLEGAHGDKQMFFVY